MVSGQRENGVGELPGGIGLLPISDEEFADLRGLVYEKFGINLTEQKRSLVVGRLQKLMRQKGFSNYRQYLDYVRADQSAAALSELINRISTNHTYFFRESSHFEFLQRTVLPDAVSRLSRRNSRDLRIWCAGCSTGEEAYTIVMTLMEFFGGEYGLWDAGLLATDISAKALNTAASGLYSEERTSGVPPKLRMKYFVKRGNGMYSVSDRLKAEITFRRFNLMNQRFPFRQPFDVIFCRNVMIYFDRPTRDALVQRFYQTLTPGGYFFIGHSESLRRESSPYRYILPAVYQKKEI
jgi:chemotaxis protein methyltransferase CheR